MIDRALKFCEIPRSEKCPNFERLDYSRSRQHDFWRSRRLAPIIRTLL